MHRYPYPCAGPVALIVHNLPGKRCKIQHGEFHCLGYLGVLGSERTIQKELFSCGV